MASAVGTSATVHVSTTDASYLLVGKLKSVSLTMDNAEVDSTTNDDAGFTSALYGNQTANLNVTVSYDTSDAQQTTMINAVYAKTKLWFRVRPTVGSGLRETRFQAVLLSMNPSASNGALVELSFTIKSDGTITNATQ